MPVRFRVARIVKIRANPTPDPPDLGSGPDPGRPGGWARSGGQVPGPGSDPEVWGPGRVARTVPEGQAPGGKMAKIAKIAILTIFYSVFLFKIAFFRKTRVLGLFFVIFGPSGPEKWVPKAFSYRKTPLGPISGPGGWGLGRKTGIWRSDPGSGAGPGGLGGSDPD